MAEELHWEEGMLEDLARAVVFPPAPDLRRPVLARIAVEPASNHRQSWRLAAAGAAVVLLVSAFVLVLSREARDAVAGFLGLAVEGERIEVLPTAPAGTTATPFPTPLPTQVQFELFARKVTRQEAAGTGIQLRLPASLGEPLAYYAVLGGPELVIADYGTIQVWQMPYTGEYFIGKGIHGGGDVVEEVRVNGHSGYWVSGGERLVTVNNATGTVVAGTQRTVTANALLWAEDGLYRRIEGAGSLEAALRIAAEMR